MYRRCLRRIKARNHFSTLATTMFTWFGWSSWCRTTSIPLHDKYTLVMNSYQVDHDLRAYRSLRPSPLCFTRGELDCVLSVLLARQRFYLPLIYGDPFTTALMWHVRYFQHWSEIPSSTSTNSCVFCNELMYVPIFVIILRSE